MWIRFGFGNLTEGDAPGPLGVNFTDSPIKFDLPGQSWSWLNYFLFLTFLTAFFGQGTIFSVLRSWGVAAEHIPSLLPSILIGMFLIQPVIAAIVRHIRTRRVTITDHDVTIDYPNNPYASPLVTPLRDYRWLSLRVGHRYRRRRKVEQDILELVHDDPARTIMLQVDEGIRTSKYETKRISELFGVDFVDGRFR